MKKSFIIKSVFIFLILSILIQNRFSENCLRAEHTTIIKEKFESGFSEKFNNHNFDLTMQQVDSVEICCKLGKEYIRKKNFNEAIKVLERGKHLFKQNTECRSLLGQAYIGRGNFNNAITEFEYAIPRDMYKLNNSPEDIKILERILNNLDKLEIAYKKVRKNKEASRCFLLAAKNLQTLGRIHDAIQNYKRVIMFQPNDAEIRFKIGKILSEEYFEVFNSGKYGGIGIQVEIDEDFPIVMGNPFSGTPASESGIKRGDKIVEVNGISTRSIDNSKVINLIRGEVGTPLSLKILRAGNDEPLIFNVIRDRISIAQNYLEQAIENFQSISNIDPDYIDVEYGISSYGILAFLFLHAKNNPQAALIQAQKALSLQPENYKLFEILGDIYDRFEQYDRAIIAYERALSLEDTDESLYYKVGKLFLKNNQIEEAIQIFLELVNNYPENPDYYNILGVAYARSNNVDKAIEFYKKATEISPDYMLAQENLARNYYRLGKIEEARSLASDIIERNPDNADMHKLMADIYLREENIEAAIENYHHSIELQPDNEDAFYSLGRIYLYQEKYEDAIWNFKKAVEIDSLDAWNHKKLGDAYRLSDKFDRAILSYLQAINMKKEFEDAYVDLGRSYIAVDNYHDAIATFENAYKINSQNKIVPNFLAYSYAKLKKYKKARNYARKGIQLNKDNTDAYFLLALTYHEGFHQYEKAYEINKMVFQKDPDNTACQNNFMVSNFTTARFNEAFQLTTEILKDTTLDNSTRIGMYSMRVTIALFQEKLSLAQYEFESFCMKYNEMPWNFKSDHIFDGIVHFIKHYESAKKISKEISLRIIKLLEAEKSRKKIDSFISSLPDEYALIASRILQR